MLMLVNKSVDFYCTSTVEGGEDISKCYHAISLSCTSSLVKGNFIESKCFYLYLMKLSSLGEKLLPSEP